MKLIENNHSEYRIIIPAGADVALNHAARELAKYLRLMGGAELPVVTDDTPAQGKEIVIGPANRAGMPDGSTLKNDGYILKTVGETLFILGQNGRGHHYGVYGLLERHLGCRFLARGVEKIPTRSTVTLPELDETVIPPLEFRETFWNASSAYGDVAIKRGFNSSSYHTMEAKHGGELRALGLAHTLFNFLSPEQYYDEHPEYFSLVDGVRLRERTQLCLTNPDVKRIVKENLRKTILKHPECTIFSVSQMDWYNPCECPECARVDAEEGSHAGTLIRFVNECADSIAEEFPHVIIETLAYQYTRKPPKITKPRPNVCVCLCSIECCFAHPLAECDEAVHFKDRKGSDATFQQDLIGWGKICKRMFIWDYTTNFHHYLAPFPNFHVLQPNMKFFLANGASGIFEQGNGESISGEFGELRMYLISRLMWDPDVDMEQAMDEFLTGYYGLAAAPIRQYIAMLTDHLVKDHVHLGIYLDPRQYITDEALEKAQALWAEAESLAADEEELARIRRSGMQVRYAVLQRLEPDDPRRIELSDALQRDARGFSISYIKEHRDMRTNFSQLSEGKPTT